MTAPIIQSKIAAIQQELNTEFPQRRDAIEVLTIAALTKQHGFLLGPPGTGKSLLVRRFVGHFPGARYFETLLSKNRPDAAVLGPYDLAKLRDESRFVRKDEGFLTWADIAFIDEIGKMSPTSGHDILAALNERIKHEVDNGRSAHEIPLHTVVAASNELPAAESEDAAALWDRLMWRTAIDYIAGNADFKRMLLGDFGPVGTQVPFEELQYAAGDVASVTLTDATMDAVIELRTIARNAGLSISDRRWRDSMAGVRASAWLRGSNETEVGDLEVLRHAMWDDVEGIGKVERLVLGLVSPENEEILQIGDDLAGLEAELVARKDEAKDKLMGFVVELNGKINSVKQQIERLRGKITTARALADLEAVADRATALRTRALEMTNLDQLIAGS